MAIYIDREAVPNLEQISGEVLSYVLRQHANQLPRLKMLKDAYLAKNMPEKTAEDDISVVVDYPRYIVDSVTGYYLGDPVKYVLDDDIAPGTRWTVQNGEVRRAEKGLKPDDDITPVLSAYRHQTISDVDAQLGRDIGIYGEAYELEYASEDARPMTVVCDPRSCFMVRDNSVDHNKLFFVTYENRERINGTKYTVMFVYTDSYITEYQANDVSSPTSFRLIDKTPHQFAEVPAVEYRNNYDRLGDFETELTLIEAYNQLMSDRLTDKHRDLDALLMLKGASIGDEDAEDLKTKKFIDGVPPEGDLKYVQRTFDETSVQVLADAITKEIHKQSQTVDMSDDAFGTASGQALKLKLLSMTMLVKSKIRSFERGLKKRFEMYNRFLLRLGEMGYVDKDSISPIFTISLPIDETGIVSVVKQLSGIVDQETLLSLLWFVKDPAATIERVKQEKAENQAMYLDTFGITANRKENVGGDDDEDDGTDSRENSE